MRDRAALYDAVRVRIEAFFDGADPNPLHGRAAARDAAALQDATAPETDINAAYLLGSFHWYRHQTTFDDDIHPTEYEPAITPLAIAYQADPDLVPDTLHEFFAEALAEGRLPLNANAQTYRGGRLLAQFESTGLAAALIISVERFRNALAATAEDSPERSGRLGNFCVALRTMAENLGPPALFAQAVEVGRAAVACAPNSEDRVNAQANLAAALAAQFKETGEPAHLHAAIETGRAALAAAPPGPLRSRQLANLADFLSSLFDLTDRLDTLDEAVRTAREAVAGFSPDEPDRYLVLSCLGGCLEQLATRTADASAMDEAVAVARAALAACAEDSSRYAAGMAQLADCLLSRFRLTGDASSIREALPLARACVAMTPPDEPFPAVRLRTLARTLDGMFYLTGESALLVERVDVQRSAVEQVDPQSPDYGGYLCDLGVHLTEMATHTGDCGMLDEAVTVLRAGMAATPADHPNHAIHMRSLSIALQSRARRTGDRDYWDEALATARAALAACPAGHPLRGSFQSSLGNALANTFDFTGDTVFLDEAVALLRAAVAATPPEDPSLPVELNNLGQVLMRYCARRGDARPMAEAVAAHRAALSAVGASHPARPNLTSGLAGALVDLADRTGETGLLIEAVDLLRDVTAGVDPAHPANLMYLYNLAIYLDDLYDATGDIALLDESVAIHRSVVAATPADDPALAFHLSGLGNALLSLGRRAGRAGAIEQAEAAMRGALAATPLDHADRAMRLHNLGNALWARYLETADPARQLETEHCYVEAGGSTLAPIHRRISSWHALSQIAMEGPRGPAGALAAAEAAVELLPQAAARSLSRRDREHLLGLSSSLPGRAAAAAVAARRPGRAVELLEQTRGLLVADAVNARGGESARLRARDRALADEFDALQTRLTALEYSDDTMAGTRLAAAAAETRTLHSLTRGPDADQVRGQAHHDVYAQWEGLLTRIRRLDGFAGFLRPPDLSTLMKQAHEGPIVFVYATTTRSDALIVTADEDEPVRVVPLPGLSPDNALEQAKLLHTVCRPAHLRDADSIEPGQQESDSETVHSILAWLWDTVAGPVLDALGLTSVPEHPERSKSWPRVWWCPIGPLAYLPLHAAGHHPAAPGPAEPGAPRTVLDRVVSSYITTIRSLASSRARPAAPWSPGPLVVAVPYAPDTEPLPGAAAEARLLKTLIPSAQILPDPTRGEVLRLLPRHRMAHFACHGATDWADPAASHLVLPDHATAPLTVLDISSLELDADLAYLSACSTTLTKGTLTEEAVHVTGAFHLAGYRHVLGTLWPVQDKAAADFAGLFYRGLLRLEGTLDPRRAAFALHQATHTMRSRHQWAPDLWAGFTHTGG